MNLAVRTRTAECHAAISQRLAFFQGELLRLRELEGWRPSPECSRAHMEAALMMALLRAKVPCGLAGCASCAQGAL